LTTESKTLQKYVIIVAGGSGTRMGNDIPKQFLLVAGKPVLMHTIECFYKYDNKINIVLVLPKSQQTYWSVLAKKYKFNINHTIVDGGNERFHSVLNGLGAIKTDNAVIGIHDGVRPLVSIETIARTYNTAIEAGSAIPVIDVTESIRVVEGNISKAVDRSKYKMVQTPQVFKSEILFAAYKQPYLAQFTDDAGVVERAGNSINLVEGNVENIKITRPMDLIIAQALLGK